ncbi:FAD-dependent oxidoreductase, partial [bacterium]|nr:FAD-dependent oxidoreductase [bacterium]
SMEEMPARKEEIENAQEEGIEMQFLTVPVRILSKKEGWVSSMECLKVKLGEPDESGRRRPLPIENSEFELEVDEVIIAVGTKANPLFLSTVPDLKLNKWGYIVADEITGKTSKEKVWAGGDIVTGSATVIEAMGIGKRAAQSINEYLKSDV